MNILNKLMFWKKKCNLCDSVLSKNPYKIYFEDEDGPLDEKNKLLVCDVCAETLSYMSERFEEVMSDEFSL